MNSFHKHCRTGKAQRCNDYPQTVSPAIARRGFPARKKRGLVGRAFCNKKRGEEKNEKEEVIYIIYNARSDIRAAVCLASDLYGIIITFNC